MAQDGKPLHAINKELRNIALQKPHVLHRTSHTPPAPSPHSPNHTSPASATLTRPHLPPVRQVQSGVSFSAITTGNRFSALQDPQNEDDIVLDDITVAPEPSLTTSPIRYRRQPHPKPHGYQPPPPTPTPSMQIDSSTHHTVVAEVHQPHSPSHHQDSGMGCSSRPDGSPCPIPTMPPQQLALPADPTCSTPSPTPPLRTEEVLSEVFTLLRDAYQLYQTGTSVPIILTTLWPTLSKLLTTFLQ
ncbi:extensin-like [Portunus trituberculatus]|uniref:extensin-like n=1 Tax=Portunus trituberculatus TaxID=210409 RepID=UPI001E1D1603|nr:extensin-like [Portunus trituberculatus]